MSEFKFSARSIRHMEGVSCKLVEIAHLALELSPIDFGIPDTGGLRKAPEQNGMYLNQKSKCDGYKKRSRHQDGEALDVYAYVDGAASWDEGHLTVIACAFLQAANTLGYRIEWGGYFGDTGWDKPHYQIAR
jgi:peptidoglycan L-alanyl-D-glutamate endopeptidase CwlK